MPILGIIASSFRSAAGPEGAYDSLATVTLSASTSSVTFAGIPSGYKHLQIRWLARSNRAGQASDGVNITLNGTAMTNGHYIFADGASVSAGVQNSVTTQVPGATATASVFGGAIVDILDYANTNKNKTVRTIGGFDANGSGQIAYTSTFQASTSAVSSLSFAPLNGTAFDTNSSFALYGVK